MGRFYKASQTDFIDYIESTPVAGSSKKGAPSSVSGLFGSLDVLPEDRPRLGAITQEYDAEINALTTELQKNPKAIQRLKPRIDALRGRIQGDYYTGEISAMRNRIDEFKTQETQIRKVFEDYPYLADRASELIQIQPLDFDPSTGKFGQIQAPNVVPVFTSEDRNKFIKGAKDIVKDKILSKVKDVEKLNSTESLLTIGDRVGVTKDQVIDILSGLITPEMIQAEQQILTISGLPGDETSYMKDGKPNLDTVWGRAINSIAEALATENFKGERMKVSDEAMKIRLRGQEARSTAKFRKKLDTPDAEHLAKKIEALYKGESYDDVSEYTGLKRDNLFEFSAVGGKGGPVVERIIKEPGKQPSVKLKVEVPLTEDELKKEIIKGTKRKTKTITKHVPLDTEFLRQVLDEDSFVAVKEVMEKRGTMDTETQLITVDPATETPVIKKKVPGLTQ